MGEGADATATGQGTTAEISGPGSAGSTYA
jgi:hypothetical protein